jgi:DNA-binding LytR/AlgR family response regulator
MEPIRIGVVEDDPTASRLVLTYLKRYHDEYGTTFVTSTFKDGADIVEGYFPAYDILLMDIEMTGMDGMQAAREIRRQDTHVVIVFITAAPQYAISGYEVQALSYLLKPVPWFAFSQELKRSIAALQRRSADSVLVEAGSNRLRLTFSEIVYAESIRHTIVIHTLGDTISMSGTLKELETQWRDHNFFRSNSCYLVNLRHVNAVEGQECVMSTGERLRISRPRKKAFLSALVNSLGADPQ